MEALPYMLHKESTKFLRTHYVLRNDIIKREPLLYLGTYQGRQAVLHQHLKSGLARENKNFLAVPVDVQLASANNGRQDIVRLQWKPYLVVWPVLLEEFPLQVRTHIGRLKFHTIIILLS